MAATKKMNLLSSSTSIFQQQFETIRPRIFLPETEETWDAIARSLTDLATICGEADSCPSADLLAAMRLISRPLISAMNSERGRLSGVAIELVAVVASCLEVAFEPLIPLFLPVLLSLSGRTSKVTVARARTCILTIIDTTHLPSILSCLLHDITDKSVSLRLTVVESTLACMNCFNPPDLEKDAHAKEIEAIVRATARDANADIRKVSRKVFEAYKLLLPSRLEGFTAPLTPTTRKYLDIQKVSEKPKPSHSHLPPSKPGLSSSTSTMRGPSSRRPPTHARSASSPAVGPDVDTPGVDRLPHIRSKPKAEMPPPKIPETTQPSRQPVPAVERKRVVSMSAAVRPVVAIAKPGPAERARPVPVSTLGPSRSRPEDSTHTTKTTSVVARRVPIHEVPRPGPEKPIRRIDNSSSTPAIRLASVPAPPVATSSKPPAPRIARKDAPTADKAVVKPKAREPAKSNLTKPTLSQISRAKTIERRVPASRPARTKAAPHKPVVTTKAELPAKARTRTVTPVIDDRVVPSASTSSLIVDHELHACEAEEVNEEHGAVAAEEQLTQTESQHVEPQNAENRENEREGSASNSNRYRKSAQVFQSRMLGYTSEAREEQHRTKQNTNLGTSAVDRAWFSIHSVGASLSA
ncbi:TOG domain-containing protein [Mycena sanguinolenta]|uniref:TOG domain-containing protein n=1 Tax=Mycena sanguinolenta TaxID=230812 RepID=A0A8H6ZI71_9AGAR|nr:TOG domain-containing protein [Mycena sanguinolenta]